jgi:hypothetical protein
VNIKWLLYVVALNLKMNFLRVQKELTLKGNIVISDGLFGHSGDNEVWTDDTKTMLDDMHKAKNRYG